jgi:hypothetical protein
MRLSIPESAMWGHRCYHASRDAEGRQSTTGSGAEASRNAARIVGVVGLAVDAFVVLRVRGAVRFFVLAVSLSENVWRQTHDLPRALAPLFTAIRFAFAESRRLLTTSRGQRSLAHGRRDPVGQERAQ